MQPIAFLRDAWKKWARKRSNKRNGSASAFDHRPSPMKSRARSHRPTSHCSSRTVLPNPGQILFEDYIKPMLMSHRWISIKKRPSSSTVKECTYYNEEITTLHHNSHRDSHPASPSIIALPSQYSSHSKRDSHVSDIHCRPGGSSRYHPPHPRLSLELLPESKTNDDKYSYAGFRSERASLSSYSSPKFPCSNLVEAISTGRRDHDRIARITPRTTRLATVPPAELQTTQSTDRERPTQPKVYNSHTTIPTSIAQSNDLHDDSPLSTPPQPPLLVRKKVPKPLVLRPVQPSSSRGMMPYSPTGMNRPGSLRSQASFSSQTKRAVGRPQTSVSPPPTSPPNSPLPTPPVDKRGDSNLPSPSFPTHRAPGPVKHWSTEFVTNRPIELVSIERPSTAQRYLYI
jgi:hypothetical protein